MKRVVYIGLSAMLASPVFAGNCETKGAHLPPVEYVAHMKSCLVESSSPANVKTVALQQKKAYCDKNVKNRALQGGEKESYLTVCMNSNEAQAQYALLNRGLPSAGTATATSDYNKTLQEAPTAAGAK